MGSFWDSVRKALGLEEDQLQQLKRKAESESEIAQELGEQGQAKATTTRADAAGVADMEVGYDFDPFGSFQPETRGYQWAPDDGVLVAPTPMTEGDEVTIRYNGLLVRNGANQIILHWGYGPGAWRDVKDTPMQRQPDGSFATRCELRGTGSLEFCFHDGAGNWDNNRGRNWSYEIHSGRLYS